MAKQVYTVSEVRDPVELPAPRRTGPQKGEFRLALEALPVGKAIVVNGLKQSHISSACGAVSREMGLKFTTGRLSENEYQITRVL